MTKANWVLSALLAVAVVALAYRPAKVYSFSPQIFPTGIEVDESVNTAGSGLKHARTTTVNCNGDNCSAQINWPGAPFPDTNYTAVCTSEQSGFAGIGEKTTTTLFVNVTLLTTLRKSFGVDCIAMHD